MRKHPGFELDEIGNYRPIRFDAAYFARATEVPEVPQEDPPEPEDWLKRKLAESNKIAEHHRKNWERNRKR
jgi:hypothetical protein